uniref:Uncharacterized protein n=1 Tax=Timema cristinae TaxID=61476 RepID=A0A7R9CDL9_TIMCR|nr:unnamed protein product [Timema cristinae]
MGIRHSLAKFVADPDYIPDNIDPSSILDAREPGSILGAIDHSYILGARDHGSISGVRDPGFIQDSRQDPMPSDILPTSRPTDLLKRFARVRCALRPFTTVLLSTLRVADSLKYPMYSSPMASLCTTAASRPWSLPAPASPPLSSRNLGRLSVSSESPREPFCLSLKPGYHSNAPVPDRCTVTAHTHTHTPTHKHTTPQGLDRLELGCFPSSSVNKLRRELVPPQPVSRGNSVNQKAKEAMRKARPLLKETTKVNNKLWDDLLQRLREEARRV